jgi:hypothetical protein
MKTLKGWFSGKTPDMRFYALDPVRGLAARWVVGVHTVFGFYHYFQLGLSRFVDTCYTVLTLHWINLETLSAKKPTQYNFLP